MSLEVENMSVMEVMPPSQELHSIAESELEDAPVVPGHTAVLKHLDTRDSIDSDVSLSYDTNSSTESKSKIIRADSNETSESSSEDYISSNEKDSGCEVSNEKVPSKDDRNNEEDEEPFIPPDDDLANRIVAQVEFYFSDINITKDAFLLKHVKRNKEGYVSLKLISSFKRVKHLAKDWRVVAYALERSTQLEINEARTKLRRKEPLPPYDQTTPSRTIVAINLPMEKPTIESVAELFRDCGEIALIRILRPGNPIPADVRSFANKHPEMASTMSALVEFDRTESAKAAIERQDSDWRTDKKCMKVVELNAPPSADRKKRTQAKKSVTGKLVDELSSSCPSSSEAEADHRYRLRRASSPSRKPDSQLQRRFSCRDSGSSDGLYRPACACCNNYCADRRYSSSGSGYDSPVPAGHRRYSLSREGHDQIYQIPMMRRYSGTEGGCCNFRRYSRDSGSESSSSYSRPHDFPRRYSRDSITSSDGPSRRFSRDSMSSEGSNFRRYSRESVGSEVFAPPFLSRNNSRDVIDVTRRTSFGSGACDHHALQHTPSRASFSLPTSCGASCSPHMPENVVRMPKGPDGSKGFGVAQSEV